MVLGIFIGGIVVGFSVGFALMALLAASGSGFQSEEAEAVGEHPACAYSPAPKFSPAPEARPQSAGLWLIAGP
jgi:hypothetical protein